MEATPLREAGPAWVNTSRRVLVCHESLGHDGQMGRTRIFAGVGLCGVGVFIPLAFLLEAATRPGGTDGDNASESLLYLQEHGTAYRLSGCCFILAALSLVRAVTAVPWRTPFLTALGSVAAGLWTFTGALRISSPGPIGHIGEYDQDWAEAAYLAVQMAGTQGGLLGGAMVRLFWVVTGCLLAWRGHLLPWPLCAMGLVALVYPLTVVLGFRFVIEDGLWLLGVGSLIIGIPAWFLASGVWMIVSTARSRLVMTQTSVA